MNERLPIRRRGYYRALKRNEVWAILIHAKKDKDPFGYLFALTYTPHIHNLIPIENPFLRSFPKGESFMQPVIFGFKPTSNLKKDK